MANTAWSGRLSIRFRLVLMLGLGLAVGAVIYWIRHRDENAPTTATAADYGASAVESEDCGYLVQANPTAVIHVTPDPNSESLGTLPFRFHVRPREARDGFVRLQRPGWVALGDLRPADCE